MTVRNPHLPEAPTDGKHDFATVSPRCNLCGAYAGSHEANQICKGEWAESGKMRSWAAKRWREDKLLEGGPARYIAQIISRQLGARATESGGTVWAPEKQYFVLLECGHERSLESFNSYEEPAESYYMFEALGHHSILKVACVDERCAMTALEKHQERNKV